MSKQSSCQDCKKTKQINFLRRKTLIMYELLVIFNLHTMCITAARDIIPRRVLFKILVNLEKKTNALKPTSSSLIFGILSYFYLLFDINLNLIHEAGVTII